MYGKLIIFPVATAANGTNLAISGFEAILAALLSKIAAVHAEPVATK